MLVTRAFDILTHQLQHYPKADCLAAKVNGTWQRQSTQQVLDTVNRFSAGLLAAGIRKEDKVAIISFNRPEWVMADLGIQQVGAISVPMYPTITEEDYRYIFKEADVRLILVSDERLYKKVSAATVGLEGTREIYSFDHLPGVKHWSELANRADEIEVDQLKASKAAITSDDLFTIIYTSGTTGNPKGVMLTHQNIVSNYKSCRPYVPVNHQHRALSFLPLCHIYERMLSVLYLAEGVSIYYAESIEMVADNLREVKPQVFATVPRLLEKVYDRIVAKGQELTGVKKALFFWALNLGLQYDVRGRSAWYAAQLKLANKLIFNKWREALGGNVIAIVSGGAALQPRLARVFGAAQIRVMEGYGLTETSPVIAVNRHHPEDHMIGTVGPPVDDVEVKIAEADGEILTRSASVMKGYYQRPDLTAEVIDADGWFHTGDIGELVEGRYLRITDRKKEMFKTSGGKYVAPQIIENKLKESLVIEQAMVVGDGRKYAAALIVPAFAGLQEWCKIHQIPYTSDAEMIQKPEVKEKFRREVHKFNEKFAQWEQIKKFELMPRLWTVESGELTPTLKVKRKIILQNNQRVIDDLYD